MESPAHTTFQKEEKRQHKRVVVSHTSVMRPYAWARLVVCFGQLSSNDSLLGLVESNAKCIFCLRLLAASTDTLSTHIDLVALKTLLSLLDFFLTCMEKKSLCSSGAVALGCQLHAHTALINTRVTLWKEEAEHGTSEAKWRRKGKKDHALMHKIRAIEHDSTRRRPVNEIRSEVWLQVCFFPCCIESERHWRTDQRLKPISEQSYLWGREEHALKWTTHSRYHQSAGGSEKLQFQCNNLGPQFWSWSCPGSLWSLESMTNHFVVCQKNNFQFQPINDIVFLRLIRSVRGTLRNCSALVAGQSHVCTS